MKILKELIDRIRYWRNADRLGPDIPWTHWRLHFKSTMHKICREKFLSFGEHAEFRPGAYAVICSKITLGARVTIRPGTMLLADPRPDGAGIIIEDDVLLGPGVHIYVTNHKFSSMSIPINSQGYSQSAPVILRKGCWLGANVTILSGVEIGENSVIGAGSVVTKSIPPGVMAAGNPAKIIRSSIDMCESGGC